LSLLNQFDGFKIFRANDYRAFVKNYGN